MNWADPGDSWINDQWFTIKYKTAERPLIRRTTGIASNSEVSPMVLNILPNLLSGFYFVRFLTKPCSPRDADIIKYGLHLRWIQPVLVDKAKRPDTLLRQCSLKLFAVGLYA